MNPVWAFAAVVSAAAVVACPYWWLKILFAWATYMYIKMAAE